MHYSRFTLALLVPVVLVMLKWNGKQSKLLLKSTNPVTFHEPCYHLMLTRSGPDKSSDKVCRVRSYLMVRTRYVGSWSDWLEIRHGLLRVVSWQGSKPDTTRTNRNTDQERYRVEKLVVVSCVETWLKLLRSEEKMSRRSRNKGKVDSRCDYSAASQNGDPLRWGFCFR